MSGPVLTSNVNSDSEQFRANAAKNEALRDELWAKVAEAALGGNEKSRERHTSRGKLLPRERVERLLDPGSPYLEIGQLAANDLYDGEIPGRNGEGWNILPDDRQKAFARAGNCRGQSPAVHLSGRQRRCEPAASGRSLSRP
jgi:hypothetical protein